MQLKKISLHAFFIEIFIFVILEAVVITIGGGQVVSFLVSFFSFKIIDQIYYIVDREVLAALRKNSHLTKLVYVSCEPQSALKNFVE